MEQIILEKDKSIATIKFNRPKKLNCMTQKMMGELAEIVESVEIDSDIRVIILTGIDDKSFSVGTDINELREVRNPLEHQAFGIKYLGRTVRYAEIIANITKPVIAMIKGYALGGGLEFAVACDIRIAAENAEFGFAEVNLGWPGGNGNTQRLPRLIGQGKAMQLLLTGERIGAIEAKEIGLVEMVCPNDQIEDKTYKIARQIASKSPVAVKFVKRAIKIASRTNLDVGLEYETLLASIAFSTEDKNEGIRAFFEKREPDFKGK